MRCPACQHENREGALFCEQCGARLERACPHCGDAVRPGARFCDRCGGPLESPGPGPLEPSPLGARAEALASRIPSYTPKYLVEKVLTTRSAIEGERKQVTVLFADVCGFTGISEALDPEEVHRLMDCCFEILMREIHRFEGTINQFTGDGVMALFGAPIAHEDAPQRAIRAALAIQEALRAHGEEVRSEQGVSLQMRIGINTGTVVVGKIGDDLRMDYTAAGDTTNLAARLQAMAEPGTVLVSEHTHRLTKDFFEFSHLGPVHVKGKSYPEAVYRALRPKAVHSRMDVAARRGLTPLVARHAELDHLMASFAKAKDGHGQVVSLVGEAGVGKSRLAYEFKGRLRGEDITLWEAYCPSYGQAIPYLPIAQIVKKYCGIEEGDDESKIRQKVGAT
ncbi:MAG: adenylate/guanylate cyclase domain-containing protein [Nitrospinota bacterium]